VTGTVQGRIVTLGNRALLEGASAFQPELFGNPGHEIVKDLEQMDIDSLTPLEALNLLAQWKQKI